MTLNPLLVEQYTFHIESDQCDSNSPSYTDFYLTLPYPITPLAANSRFCVQVSNIEIPFCFNQLPLTINNLNVNLVNPADGGPSFNTTIYITPGNYDVYTLMNELVIELQNAGSEMNTVGLTNWYPTFANTYDDATGFMSLALTNPGFEIDIYFSQNTTLGAYFGFSYDIALTNKIGPPYIQEYAISNLPAITNPINYLLLRSSLKQYRNREYIVQPGGDSSDILYKVPVTTLANSYINYYQVSDPVYITDVQIGFIEFYLTNNLTYDPINLKGIPFAFTFIITEVLRHDYTGIATALAINKPLIDKTAEEQKNDEIKELISLQRQEIERLKKYQEKLSVPQSFLGKSSAKIPEDESDTSREGKIRKKKKPLDDYYELINRLENQNVLQEPKRPKGSDTQ